MHPWETDLSPRESMLSIDMEVLNLAVLVYFNRLDRLDRTEIRDTFGFGRASTVKPK